MPSPRLRNRQFVAAAKRQWNRAFDHDFTVRQRGWLCLSLFVVSFAAIANAIFHVFVRNVPPAISDAMIVVYLIETLGVQLWMNECDHRARQRRLQQERDEQEAAHQQNIVRLQNRYDSGLRLEASDADAS